MTPEELDKLVAHLRDTMPYRKSPDRVIGSRRYNLVVFEKRDGEKIVVETIEYLTMKQARELKKEYREEDGYKCDIVEDVTTDRNGNEIIFHEKPEIPIVKGLGGFGTPEATKSKIERNRRENREKSTFVKKARKVNGPKEIRRSIHPSDPSFPGHEIYMEAIEKRGFTVTNKVTQEVFKGLQNETRDFILHLLKIGYSKSDLDIRFNGV